MLDTPGLSKLIDERFTSTAFRLETLPAYEVDSDRHKLGDAESSDFDRYLAGEPEPTWLRKQPWLDTLAAEREALRYRYRVRILGGPDGLSDPTRETCPTSVRCSNGSSGWPTSVRTPRPSRGGLRPCTGRSPSRAGVSVR
jgi:hypothetical protein